jgi:hypothetical protein
MNRIAIAGLAALLSMGGANAEKTKKAVALPTPVMRVTPKATPVPCPATASLEIGQTRTVAFEMMSRKDITNELHVHHAPANRPYHVELNFDGPSKDAKVIGLHYVFNPPAGLRGDIEKRYGKPTLAPADSPEDIWNLPACRVRLRYKMLVTAKENTPIQEEMWVEPLSLPLKAKAPPK